MKDKGSGAVSSYISRCQPWLHSGITWAVQKHTYAPLETSELACLGAGAQAQHFFCSSEQPGWRPTALPIQSKSVRSPVLRLAGPNRHLHLKLSNNCGQSHILILTWQINYLIFHLTLRALKFRKEKVFSANYCKYL